jgi:hypothetical protein
MKLQEAMETTTFSPTALMDQQVEKTKIKILVAGNKRLSSYMLLHNKLIVSSSIIPCLRQIGNPLIFVIWLCQDLS